MNIEYKNDKTIKILLTNTDLEKYKITYDELDYENIKTKEFLLSILKQVNKSYKINKQKIFIEAYPTNNKGCLLYINFIDNDYKCKNDTSFDTPLIFKFENIETLSKTCTKLFKENLYMIIKSALYYYNDEYYLLIYSYCRMEKNLSNILKEYGTFIGKGAVFSSFLQEHSKQILCENAIENINKYL